jgi:hypothetical protein
MLHAIILELISLHVKHFTFRFPHIISFSWSSPPIKYAETGSGCENGLKECSSEPPVPVGAKPLVPQVVPGQIFLVSPPWL